MSLLCRLLFSDRDSLSLSLSLSIFVWCCGRVVVLSTWRWSPDCDQQENVAKLNSALAVGTTEDEKTPGSDISTVLFLTHSELIPPARKIEFESCK